MGHALQHDLELQIGSDMARIVEREHAINTQVSGLAADLREAKQQLSASQEERLQLEKSNQDLEVDLNSTVQVLRRCKLPQMLMLVLMSFFI